MEPLAAVLPSAVRQVLRGGPMSPGKLDFAWRVAVGAAIARATEVRLRDDGCIEVLAREPSWRRELKRSQRTILARVQDLLGPEVATGLKVLGKGR